MTPRASPEHGPSIVVGYDGSESARRALIRAGQLAGASGRVTVVCASPLLVHLGRVESGENGTPRSSTLLEEAASTLAGLGVAHEETATPLEPADALIEAAQSRGAKIVVVGTRGRGRAARTALGSVSTAVLRHAPCDVLVVRRMEADADAGRDWPRDVVVGYDASPWARRALDRAAEIVRPGGRVHIVTVAATSRRRRAGNPVSAADLRKACDRVTGQGLVASVHEGQGDPATVILEAAGEHGADLVAVGSRSRGQTARLILGSVSTAVVHGAEQDVLVVRQQR